MTAPMITRCTHCGTAFRVYAHQLEKRAGQVRCGACGEVFDAYSTLAAVAPVAPEQPEPIAPAVAPAPPAPAPAPEEQVAQPESASMDARGALSREPATPVEEHETDRYAEAAEPAYDFGPAPPPPEKRAALLVGLIALATLCLLQAIFWFRSEIAARAPALAPALNTMCTLAGCKITLPKRTDFFTIESSDLQSDGDYLVLIAILRNRAGFTQDYPAIELTLTDPRDQPLVRRVLTARDYLDPSVDAALGARADAEVLARVYIDATGLNANGYRVVLFHP